MKGEHELKGVERSRTYRVDLPMVHSSTMKKPLRDPHSIPNMQVFSTQLTVLEKTRTSFTQRDTSFLR